MFQKRGEVWTPAFTTHALGTAFAAGDWNVGPGGGRFIPVMRKELPLAKKAAAIKAAGATHMEFHDTEAMPKDAQQIAKIVHEAGLGIHMATANLFKRKEFVNGNFGCRDPKTRRRAIKYTKDYIATAIEVYRAEVYVYWNGSSGSDVPLGTDYMGAYQRTAECLTEIATWMYKTYGNERAIPICIEPKPNEPRGFNFLADVGEALAVIAMMPKEIQYLVGLNVETCHSQMAGKRFAVELGLAAAAGKLYYIHLNGGSQGPRFDEDRAFGDLDPSIALETVLTLREIGYSSVVGVDVQPLPTDRNDQQAESIARSIRNFQRAMTAAKRIKMTELNALRDAGDQAGIAELFSKAVFGC